ncbi:hypothetical protein PHMEG_00026680 [Phytophthora megakarya]|uniref:Uncharacterized protein n=1 Tax=Phytophthora megakarya TaxID=4795 RepID=A0A225V971_9STRA|nr:hypothetical protein PHMEG_00026680 [Phytophthora megakarya]
MNPGGRYDNAELSGFTKVLINSPSIKLPKLQSKGMEKRCAAACHFTYDVERFDDAEGLRRMQYKKWYEMRKNKALSALALSLSADLRTTFKIDDIREHMDAAAMLYARITQHFEAGDDLVTRKQQPNESVTTYVEDIARKMTQLHQVNGKFAEWQHASLLLSNFVQKFHDLARKHGDFINNHDRKTLSLAEALPRLRVAEHQRVQLRAQTRQPALRVAKVSADQGQGSCANRKRGQKQRERNKFVADKKQRTSCANCQGEGH